MVTFDFAELLHGWNPFYFLFPLLAYFLSRLFVAALYPKLVKAKLIAHPEARSNHKNPTVTGGGLGILFAAISCLLLASFSHLLAGLAAVLCLVSFYDDMRPMRASIRLLAQCGAVGVALWAMPPLPFSETLGDAAYVLFALAWIWWINLSNFMDGIDEMTIQQVCMSMLGVAGIFLLAVPYAPTGSHALIIIAATLAFINWNKHPARMFMGDAGSVPLGFLTGYFFITLMQEGFCYAALILPAYYVTDATSTLIKRVARGENPTKAHSEHAYQHAVRAGYAHSTISHVLALLNLVLVFLAIAVLYQPQFGLHATIAAYVLSAAACVVMRRLKGNKNA